MTERRGSFRTVVADPNLRRVELAFLGFNMTEFATWIAILLLALLPSVVELVALEPNLVFEHLAL